MKGLEPDLAVVPVVYSTFAELHEFRAGEK